MKKIYSAIKRIVTLVLVLFYSLIYTQTIFTEWNFNGPNNSSIPGGSTNPLPSIGSGTASLIGGTTAFWSAGNPGPCDSSNGECAWNTQTYPPQATASGSAGVMFSVSTVGKSNIAVSFDHRASASASRFSRFEYSLDNGTTWNIVGTNNGTLSPQDTFVNYIVNLSSCTACNNHPNLLFRVVSIFSPFAFNQNQTLTSPSGFFAPNTNYMRAHTDAQFPPNPGLGTGNYATSATWRFDNVRFWENAASLSVEDVIVTKKSFDFYPNPAPRDGKIFLSEIKSLEIFDMNGRVVKVVENTNEVDLNGLSFGNYILRTNDGATSRLIIK